MSLSLQDGLLDFGLQPIMTHELMMLTSRLSQIWLKTEVAPIKQAQLGRESIRDEDIDVFEVVRLQRWRCLQLFVI